MVWYIPCNKHAFYACLFHGIYHSIAFVVISLIRSKLVWSICQYHSGFFHWHWSHRKWISNHKIYWYITLRSQWASWRLKSPASRLFAQPFVQAHIKENIKVPRHWPLWGESTGHPSQGTSNVEKDLMTSSWGSTKLSHNTTNREPYTHFRGGT